MLPPSLKAELVRSIAHSPPVPRMNANANAIRPLTLSSLKPALPPFAAVYPESTETVPDVQAALFAHRTAHGRARRHACRRRRFFFLDAVADCRAEGPAD